MTLYFCPVEDVIFFFFSNPLSLHNMSGVEVTEPHCPAAGTCCRCSEAEVGRGDAAESVCLETISPRFALLTIDPSRWLVRGRKDQIIGQLNGGVAATTGSITDQNVALLAFG